MKSAFEIAENQLREIADASDGSVQIHDVVAQTSIYHYPYFEVSIRFDGLQSTEDGISVRARESFLVFIPSTFPFEYPLVQTLHTRFSGLAHVQWRRQLCLYGSSQEWKPEDGMNGFIKRLDTWIRDAANNNLDPNDAPLHPPVQYPTIDRLYVPKKDTPIVDDSPWIGLAELRILKNRTEIVDWRKFEDELPDEYGIAILLAESLPFEYPKTILDLFSQLLPHGLQPNSLISLLGTIAQHNTTDTPLTVVLGSPMRRVVPGGRKLQHLAVWEISTEDADNLRKLKVSLEPGKNEQVITVLKSFINWSRSANVGWCNVSEMRPEVTRSRDCLSSMAWFRKKRVAIWGCGAIGTHVAESVVRAGAKSIVLVDNKIVTQGLLVRQGFEDSDIGLSKSQALATRLKRIQPDLDLSVFNEDLIPLIMGSDSTPSVDLIIDCTASSSVRAALERALRDINDVPPIASIAVNSKATMALATLSMPDYSGHTLDLLRRLKLELCRKSTFSKELEAFWPRNSQDEKFQPEPGCSEPTFIGSHADLASLSARMLNSIAYAVASPTNCDIGLGWLCGESGSVHEFVWPSDHKFRSENLDYSIRVSVHAEREMRGWARRSVRMNGAKIETGGYVFGELNEAAGVLWVTDVEGPPPDSHASESHFTCGIEGMRDAAAYKRKIYRRSVDCIGSWHTHPMSPPHLSNVDIKTVVKILNEPNSARRTYTVLILSGSPESPELGAEVFRTPLHGGKHSNLPRSKTATSHLKLQSKEPKNIGLALSGGGSRAIAFHLGCFRALHDVGLLNRVQVVSSVSGGSIIGALYAYSNDEFQVFDTKVVSLLNQGLKREIVREIFKPTSIVKSLASQVTVIPLVFLRSAIQLVQVATRMGDKVQRSIPLPVRRYSWTEAFRAVLAHSHFGDIVVQDVARESLHTVINATELRTGSAFRFGSKKSGCWRFGTIEPEVALVADAVAASAAYPVFLPALNRKYTFTHKQRGQITEQVLLADGGIFENIGISPMEAGRTASISTNTFNPDYIICCDAGTGLFDDDSYPMFWPSRMTRSFLTVFRKVQDAARNRLHKSASSHEISGFVLCYLGQQDEKLPWIPANLPKLEEVRDYPTNFSAMSRTEIDRLALRGELLMRLLLSYYHPDL